MRFILLQSCWRFSSNVVCFNCDSWAWRSSAALWQQHPDWPPAPDSFGADFNYSTGNGLVYQYSAVPHAVNSSALAFREPCVLALCIVGEIRPLGRFRPTQIFPTMLRNGRKNGVI